MSRELYSIEKNSIKENRKYIIIQFDTLHDFLEILFCCLSVFTYYLPLKLKFSNNRIFYNKTPAYMNTFVNNLYKNSLYPIN